MLGFLESVMPDAGAVHALGFDREIAPNVSDFVVLLRRHRSLTAFAMINMIIRQCEYGRVSSACQAPSGGSDAQQPDARR